MLKLKPLIICSVAIAALATYAVITNASDTNSNAKINTTTVSIHSNYIAYDEVDALEEAAELVVFASPLKKFEDREHVNTYFGDGQLQDYYTLTEIKIDKVVKAPADFVNSDTLTVVEPIGLIKDKNKGNIKLALEDYSELSQGKEYVIFLKKNTYGQYGIINMELGKFSTDENQEEATSSVLDNHAEKNKEFHSAVMKKYNVK
jgi:hypothetical protein